ncbi:DUF262 domain-containing protein [Chitinophaga parva]|uniref:DUF262 domain-containing protein n=1 Tax=Chitinophaga parva TaxID=2169414 RepID=A0A2T7BGU2_9BACT|nr:DUF262 domain-containing protein [Chitinophaga parva]PUZ25496.1 DUF262 domain-containing protein [Chitinophaga parva]
MENRVYYGQYSLKHWLDLILKQNIILPDYQRFFVWNEGKVRTLINALKNKQFVPPITIGAFNMNGTMKNLILDGQQRLTTILLAHLGLFPDKDFYKGTIERLADENDDDVDVEEQFDNILKWNFKELTAKGNNKDVILGKIIEGNYKVINDFGIDDDFLKKTFLGFSYLVPQNDDQQIQQKYYSSVFRSINIGGVKLLPQESRESLYFLKDGLKDFFGPAFIKRITISNFSSESPVDFLRFIALLSQYKKEEQSTHIAGGFKSKMEEYYEEYIYSVVGGEDKATKFVSFAQLFPDGNYQVRLERLNSSIIDLRLPTKFTSIIEMDTYLFGMVYIIVFENRSIDISKRDHLIAEIELKIAEFKNVAAHKKAPSALKYLRNRITSSIEIYNKYLHG